MQLMPLLQDSTAVRDRICCQLHVHHLGNCRNRGCLHNQTTLVALHPKTFALAGGSLPGTRTIGFDRLQKLSFSTQRMASRLLWIRNQSAPVPNSIFADNRRTRRACRLRAQRESRAESKPDLAPGGYLSFACRCYSDGRQTPFLRR